MAGAAWNLDAGKQSAEITISRAAGVANQAMHSKRLQPVLQWSYRLYMYMWVL